jgi:undecaprenyl-diphosphatase
VREAFHATDRLPLLVAMTAAAVSGWLAIAALLRFVRTRSLGVFAVYRIALGLAVLGLVWARSR